MMEEREGHGIPLDDGKYRQLPASDLGGWDAVMPEGRLEGERSGVEEVAVRVEDVDVRS